MTPDLGEHKESLWVLAAPPALWAVHFLLSYATAAIWCAKLSGPGGSLGGARIAIAVYTVVALVAVGLAGARGYARHRLGDASLPHDADTAEDRHRFLGFATVLLAGLSAVAIVYSGLAALFIRSCD